MKRFAFVCALGCLLSLSATAAEPLKRKEWKVGDTTREAFIYAPAKAASQPAPLVFVFHGHGGNMRFSATKATIHEHWPEAICVYPQGLNTPVPLVDKEGKYPGWQVNAGEQGNRDLKFFDEMLKTIRKDYQVDDKRIYVTGHSNGGRFTQLLWAERGDVFAAVAPSGTVAGPLLTRSMKPKPCLYISGEKDETVKFEGQKFSMDAVKKLNGCDADGRPWQKDEKLPGTIYASKGGPPLVTLIYPGGHAPPPDTPKRIASFFKEYAKR